MIHIDIDMFLDKLALTFLSSGDVQESHLGGTFREGAEQGPKNFRGFRS